MGLLFEECYEERYAKTYGSFRIIRIKEAVLNVLDCGDYTKGIARIQCTNPECKHEYFRPFSCKTWYLCPSCHQKRILLLAEHLDREVLLHLPHRQFVFSIPKILRPYFRYDRKLFAGVTRIIHELLEEYCQQATGKDVRTGAVVSYQSFGDMLRFNPHWHSITLEGCIDISGVFHHLPVKDTAALTECFRRRIVEYFVEKELLNKDFARNLLSWRHSGFSVDNSVQIVADDHKAREGLAQYISRHPVSLKKIIYVPAQGKVIYKTKYNQYFGENIKLITAVDFIALLTAHIPEKHKHLIRYYGIYSSRTKGKAREDGSLDKFGFGMKGTDESDEEASGDSVETITRQQAKSAWARMIRKVYEVDPLVCPKCGEKMRVLAVITGRQEILRILEHLKRNKAPPFDNVYPQVS